MKGGGEMKHYYTTQEIADLLEVTYGTAYSWIKEGVLPAYKFRREYRISVRDFNKFVKDKKVNNKVVVVK
ncbi:hypothetical protein ES708_21443 [subsurface metagenome]